MTAETPTRTPFQARQSDGDRTLRMEIGGLCQLCARPAQRRVELHSPLWASGPILYGDCCLPRAEEALYAAKFGPKPVPTPPAVRPTGRFWKAWQIVALTVSLLSAVAGLKWLI